MSTGSTGEVGATATDGVPAGTPLVPQRFEVDAAHVARWLDIVGDDRFAAFAAGVREREGIELAPLTLFDREMSTYLVGNGALKGRIPPFGVHAAQTTRYRAPLRVGRTYELRGHVLGVETRPGLDHLRVAVACVDVEDPAVELVQAVYVRAQGFRGERYERREPGAGGASGREGKRRRPTRDEWLEEAGADPGAAYPAPGAVVEGIPRRITQEHLDRFLGPGPNFHTDLALARKLGFATTIAAGVMATQVECDLHRDLFGMALFRAAELEVRYVAPIPEGSLLTPVAVVEASEGGRTRLRTVVATETGLVVTTSRLDVTADA